MAQKLKELPMEHFQGGLVEAREATGAPSSSLSLSPPLFSSLLYFCWAPTAPISILLGIRIFYTVFEES